MNPIDIDSALKCLGSRHVLRVTVESFLAETDAMMACLGEAVEAGDLAAVKDKAHWIKGGLVYLHAEPSSLAAKRLEDSVSRGMEATGQAFGELQKEISKLKEALRDRGLFSSV